MQIHAPVLFNDPRPVRRSATGGAAPHDALVEPVLQGEFLQGQATAQARAGADDSSAQGFRREDHPAFYRRYANASYQQRQAVLAYQAGASVQQHAAPAPQHLDYFL